MVQKVQEGWLYFRTIARVSFTEGVQEITARPADRRRAGKKKAQNAAACTH